MDTPISNSLLRGTITAKSILNGTISAKPTLSGNLTLATGSLGDIYDGDYNVIPSTDNEQILATAKKLLLEDVVVAKVPYFETSNESDGKTVYIGKDV